MEAAFYAKLKTGLKLALDAKQEIPPIVVRPDPGGKWYQIIDGYHRWKALGELGQERVNVYSITADDKNARILTNTLNYLRGKADRRILGQNIVELLELGSNIEELASLLPENADDLDMLLQESDVSLEALSALHEGGGNGEGLESLENAGHDDPFVELKFRVSVEQCEVIEREIKRISDRLKGKNARGRALEYMAVLSNQGKMEEQE